MDKRNKQVDKKTDKIKDRGDLKKTTYKTMAEDDLKDNFADRGDTATYQKLIRLKTNESESKGAINRSKLKNISNATFWSEKNIEESVQKQALSNFDIRKSTRERYNMKHETNLASNICNEVTTHDSKPQTKSDRAVNQSKKRLPEPQAQKKQETHKENSKDTTITYVSTKRPKDTTTTDINTKNSDEESTTRKPDKESINRKPDKESTNRKPIIKTVTSKNTSKIFKAVTFGDMKSQPKPLRINIQSNEKVSKIIIPSNVTKSTNTVTVPKTNRAKREKPEIRRRMVQKRIRKNEHESPDSLKLYDPKSPPTEVAKWAPCCVNKHTKPYYEAWVNTTLAAISKSSKNDKLFLEKRRIIQSFQRALEERADSPTIYYENLNDERYTGRIRVIHR